jgi:hypothetical protein
MLGSEQLRLEEFEKYEGHGLFGFYHPNNPANKNSYF